MPLSPCPFQAMAITKRLCCIIVDTQGRKVMVRKKVSEGVEGATLRAAS